MFKDLIEYADVDEACDESFGFSNVTLIRDFGPLKKEQKLVSLWFHLETRMVQGYLTGKDLEENKANFEFFFKLEAI